MPVPAPDQDGIGNPHAREKKMLNRSLVNSLTGLGLVVTLTLSGGCATTGGGTSTQAEGATLGAILGGVIGAAACDSHDRAKCIATGAVIGGTVGFVAGQVVAERQARYANQEDFYDAQIQQTAQLNQALSTKNRNLRKSIQRDRRHISKLMARYNQGKASRQELLTAKANLDKQRTQNEKVLADAKRELEVQREVYKQMQQQGQAQRQRVKQQERVVTGLQAEVNDLQQNIELMATSSAAVNL